MAINEINTALTNFTPYVPKMKLQQTITSSQSVTLPAGTQYYFAVVVGGGGSGRTLPSTASSTIVAWGGSAGGINWGLVPTLGITTFNAVVGAGGAGFSAGTNTGNPGGSSSFGAIAAGGGGGGGVSANASGNKAGGAGGAPSQGDTPGTGVANAAPQSITPNGICNRITTGLLSFNWQAALGTTGQFTWVTGTSGVGLTGRGGQAESTGPAASNGDSSRYYSGGTASSGNGAGGGGAGWTGNGANAVGQSSGAGGSGGGGGGGMCNDGGTSGAGGNGVIQLYY